MVMPKSKVAANRFVAQMYRESYYAFFKGFWSTVVAEKLIESWYIKKLCDELQEISERVFDDKPKTHDLIWNCPPNSSKSSCVSVLWQPWIWTRMPSARFISGSHSERLALDLSRKSRDVVESEYYKSLFPEVVLRPDQNTKGYFATTKGGFRYAVGVGSSVVGFHAHFLVIDDPIDPLSALSDLMLDEANSWMKETLSRRKVHQLITVTALIMQRLHQDDPTGNMMERGTSVKQFVLPGEDVATEDGISTVKPEYFRQFYEENNGLMDPIRWPREALESAYKDLGEAGYAGQILQMPVPRGGAMFKTDRLHYESNPPVTWKRGPVRGWDKAGTKTKRSAYTVGVKIAEDMLGRIWILDVIRDQWNSAEREDNMVSAGKADLPKGRQVVEQEPASSGLESADRTIKRMAREGVRCIAVPASGNKELRADSFSQEVNAGNVILVNAHWNKAFVEELKFFPRSKYKDQVDAASLAHSQLTGKKLKIGALR